MAVARLHLRAYMSGVYLTFEQLANDVSETYMGVIGEPLVWLVLTVIDIYIWIVIIGVVMSWLVAFKVINTSNRFVYMVGDMTHRMTEPALKPIRNMLPQLNGIDLSPMALILGLIVLKKIVHNIYMGML